MDFEQNQQSRSNSNSPYLTPLPHLSKRIANFFNKTDPIRASMISVSTMLIILIICIPCACKLLCPSFTPTCCITNICRNNVDPYDKAVKQAANRYKRTKHKELTFSPTESAAPMIEQTVQETKNINMIRNIQPQFQNSFQ